MPTLRVRAAARDEIAEAFEWYLARSDDAPERFPVVRGRMRRVLLRRFPYAVYYKVYPTVISVVGVIHGHRHPDTWLRRAAP